MALWNLFPDLPANLYPAEDDGAVSLGTEFTVQQACRATQIRWIRAISANAAQRYGAIYRVSDRARLTPIVALALAPEGGWLGTDIAPLDLVVGETYRVVVWHPAGRYLAAPGFFVGQPIQRGPVALASSTTSVAQGSYEYGGALGFPAQTFGGASYFADLTLDDAVAPPVDPEPATKAITIRERTAQGWQDRTVMPRAFSGVDWIYTPPSYWDGGKWVPL